MEVGVVYFIQAEMQGHPLKIGFTAGDARTRLADLQTGSPMPLYLIGTVAGSKAFERWFHRLLAEHRILGEWFRGNDRVRAVVLRALQAARDPRVDDPQLAMRLWYRPG